MKLLGLSDQRQALAALRDRLAQLLDGDIGHRAGCRCDCGVPPDLRTLPSTAKEFREVLRDLADLPEATGANELDQLAAARAARQAAARSAAAADQVSTAVPDKRRTRSRQARRDSGAGA